MTYKKRYIYYYNKAIELYGRKDFKDIISERKLLNIKNCYNEYSYWYKHPEWDHKVFRCKKAVCPVCDMKNKAIKYFKFIDKILELRKNYEVFCLTLNGNNVEINVDKINREIENNNNSFQKLLNKAFMKKIVRKYLKVTEIKYTYYDSLPHIHIILFVIKGIYKHFKIKELKDLITKEWTKLKGFNANVFLEKLGTEKKLKKTISYLTVARKKQLYTLFDYAETLKVHLKVTNNKRLFVWSRKDRGN